MIRLDEVCELLGPSVGRSVEPFGYGLVGREDDGLTVVEPGKVFVGVGGDDSERP